MGPVIIHYGDGAKDIEGAIFDAFYGPHLSECHKIRLHSLKT